MASAGGPVRVELPVRGMTCSGCVSRLEGALGGVPGVLAADVSLALESATVTVDGRLADSVALLDAVARSGFDVPTEERTFAVQDMTCSACAARVERALRSHASVVDAEVNLALESATVTLLPGTSIKALAERVAGAGYGLRAEGAAAAEPPQAEDALAADRRAVLIATVLTVPLVFGMVMRVFGYDDLHLMPAGEVLLATPVQFVLGARFYRAALSALRGGSANMDVLVVLGTTAAYLYSWYLLVTLGEAADGELYFEASAVIITLVLLGRLLEARARRATTSAIRQLMALRPETARVRDAAGNVATVPAGAVEVGQTVLVRPGERIAVDGVVDAGESDIDESLVTGESEPVAKTAGQRVTGGSVNVTGYLEVRATAVGEASALARIVALVAAAQRGKAGVQRLVDRISALFVPAIVVIAAVTLLAWLALGGGVETALVAAVSVLVIACPCALGLATPTAVIAGTGAAARAGILFKDASTLERGPKLTTVVFDKTGTLTEGRPTVTGVQTLRGSERELLRRAAGVQQASEHPLALATVDYARRQGVEPATARAFRNHVGQGVRALVDGGEVRVGSLEFVAGEDTSATAANDAAEDGGQTTAWVADAEGVVGALTFADPVRPGASDAVATLAAMGVRSVLLSGDAKPVVARVARETGIDEAHAAVLPADKAGVVRELAAQGERVAMVGDGVNDAPALAAADVGMAMGTGTDIAMETAGVTLMRPAPGLVPGAIKASRATVRKIKQNLFWAFVYNVIGIPLAAFGYLSPALAGAAMAFSSVCVVANSLLLRRWRAAPV